MHKDVYTLVHFLRSMYSLCAFKSGHTTEFGVLCILTTEVWKLCNIIIDNWWTFSLRTQNSIQNIEMFWERLMKMKDMSTIFYCHWPLICHFLSEWRSSEILLSRSWTALPNELSKVRSSGLSRIYAFKPISLLMNWGPYSARCSKFFQFHGKSQYFFMLPNYILGSKVLKYAFKYVIYGYSR
mgnify:CR=1 FL=1